jgi:hypothetical protein
MKDKSPLWQQKMEGINKQRVNKHIVVEYFAFSNRCPESIQREGSSYSQGCFFFFETRRADIIKNVQLKISINV